MDLDLGEGTQLVVWLGWEHNPLVQLGWMRELSKCMHLIYYVQSVARQQNRFEGSSGGSRGT